MLDARKTLQVRMSDNWVASWPCINSAGYSSLRCIVINNWNRSIQNYRIELLEHICVEVEYYWVEQFPESEARVCKLFIADSQT